MADPAVTEKVQYARGQIWRRKPDPKMNAKCDDDDRVMLTHCAFGRWYGTRAKETHVVLWSFDWSENYEFEGWAVGYGPSEPATVDLSRYPSKCKACKGPAYVGLNSVDCYNKCRPDLRP